MVRVRACRQGKIRSLSFGSCPLGRASIPAPDVKLLFLIASLQCGGAERVATTLCNRFAEQGWEITVATFDDGRTPPFFPLRPEVRHVALGIRGESSGPLDKSLRNLRRVSAVRAAIASAGPDRIVSFIDSTNVLALLAARGNGVGVVVSERIDPARHRLPATWRLLRRLTYRSARAIVVQTSAAAEYFPRAWRERIAVIPNPVSAPPFPVETGDRETRIVAMGRLAPQKGFDLLLEAFARVAPERPEWILEIYGEGPERGALAASIERLGLAGRALLPGRAPDAGAVFRRAGLFALSSRYEGFPNALAEAMACGVPAVVLNCASGPAEIVRDEIDGLLVPEGDVGGLAAALLRLTGDRERRRAMGARAAEVAGRFSVDRVASLWFSLLEGSR